MMISIGDRYKYKTTGSIWEVANVIHTNSITLVCIFSNIDAEIGTIRNFPIEELFGPLWEYRQPIERMPNEPDVDVDKLTSSVNLDKQTKENLVMPKEPDVSKSDADRPKIPTLNKNWVDKVPIIRYRGTKGCEIHLLECHRDYLLYSIENRDITVNKYILNENDYIVLIKNPDVFWDEYIDPFLKTYF